MFFLVIIMSFMILIRTQESACFQNEVKYIFVNDNKNFNTAVTECQTINANLAEITTTEQFNFVINQLGNIMNNENVWIGLKRDELSLFPTDTASFSYLISTETSFFATAGVDPWGTGQPNNNGAVPNQACIEWRFTNNVGLFQKWNDFNCGQESPYLCQTSIGCTPTTSPTNSPSVSPTKNPTLSPTESPTTFPTQNPTISPTKQPTESPSKSPTVAPSSKPTQNPTKGPSQSPTLNPTRNPTISPTRNPTSSPTGNPTKNPTKSPTKGPTQSPSKSPVNSPTTRPTSFPTGSPTL